MVGSQLESMLLTGDHRCIVGIGVKFIDSLIRYSEKKVLFKHHFNVLNMRNDKRKG